MKRGIALLLVIAGGCAGAPSPHPGTAAHAPAAEHTQHAAAHAAPRPALAKPLRIALVGDIMMGTDYPEDLLPEDDGIAMFAAARGTLRAADLALGNLEGVLQDGGEPFKVCRNPSRCYLFRTPSRYAWRLHDAGFDMLSLANNHARDFGEQGRDATMANLDAVGIAHSGREGDIASVTTGGRQVAFIAFSPTVGSHLLLDTPAAVERVQALAATHDLVIVSFHGGAEGPDALRVPYGEEFHLGEPRGNLREFCRAVIDAGADVVFGHGPHVVRGIEIYRDRLIAYSLGNFATWWGISVEELKGVAPILVVDVDGAGRFVMGRIESLLQTRERGLVADPERQALHLMAQLSRDDFGAGAPRFDAEGKFFKNAEREL